jgi:hypothetical protein
VACPRHSKKTLIAVVIVPRDSFRNNVGPDRLDAFTVTGTTLTDRTRQWRRLVQHGRRQLSKEGKRGVVLARPVRRLHKSATRPGVPQRK